MTKKKNYRTFPYFNPKRFIPLIIAWAAVGALCFLIPNSLVGQNLDGHSPYFMKTAIWVIFVTATITKTFTYNLFYINRIRRLGIADTGIASVRYQWLSTPYEKELKEYNVSDQLTGKQRFVGLLWICLWLFTTVIVVMVGVGKLATH